MRRCATCGKEKPDGDFPRDATKSSGYASRCRTCDRARAKEQYRKKAALRRLDANKRAEVKRVGKVRPCRNCGEPATSSRHHYCDACRPEQAKPVAKTSERGYGSAHVKERKRYERQVKAGNAFCARCGGHIEPGSEWHLDHTDDRSGYLGPSHAACNEEAARRPRRRHRAQSRDWGV